ncbi:MAG: stage V sporulation protein AE [Bacilli bacterium]|nr:stage V sporulation protein AE [Bacilli bacterium]
MNYVNAFLFCGAVCLIGQLILDNTKLTPGHVTTLFVVVGALLDVFNVYDKFVLWAGGGAIVPITSFGHMLIHGAMQGVGTYGLMGLCVGMFNLTSAGIMSAIVISFFLTVFFKPKD